MKSIIWFRNDLRIDDNPAMRVAYDNSTEVHAVSYTHLTLPTTPYV